MPKLTNHEEVKQSIAEAAWKIILEQGLGGASVRAVAKEAGVSLGALRYYFSTQEELIAYSRELVYQRTAERMRRVFKLDMPPKEKIVQVLLNLLPSSEEKRLEVEARLVFKVYTRHKGDKFDAQKDSVYLAIKEVMSYLVLLNLLKKDSDLHLETERLYCLMDGLALDAMIRPELLEANRMKRIIIYHLNSACSEEFGTTGW
ncbi:TetR/AcrR family transcriptional regulator [Planococcus shenhongbingii]|uniref:TetR family transcriptional regulator C-terminal domain-containing protein n=1 Tax=Planococcus shenhongbingii TaxID=3058398 RepID=A0ABT8NH12_9BACL|nr:TetR family transcriptional regulator C-terminal domain-containing protein [Planococcus sp. N017]MDN7247009.1 TetR family transcriptional regulator C-terminal domain-containing protein [Planococcus sp. N017]